MYGLSPFSHEIKSGKSNQQAGSSSRSQTHHISTSKYWPISRESKSKYNPVAQLLWIQIGIYGNFCSWEMTRGQDGLKLVAWKIFLTGNSFQPRRCQENIWSIMEVKMKVQSNISISQVQKNKRDYEIWNFYYFWLMDFLRCTTCWTDFLKALRE